MKKLLTLLLVCMLSMAAAFAQNGKYIGTVKINPLTPTQSINFNIMSGNYSTAFRIDSKTGDLFVNNQKAIDAYSSWRYILVVWLRYTDSRYGAAITFDTLRTIRIMNFVDSKLIGQFIAKDPDTKQNQKLSYYFMSGNYSTAFRIDASGNITVANAAAINLRIQTYDRYVLNIRVRDNGNPNMTTYANANILILADCPRQDVFNCRYP